MSTRWTLAEIRKLYPTWVNERQGQREKAWRRNAEKDKPYPDVVFEFVLDVHLRRLPESHEAVAWALELACGHDVPHITSRADKEPQLEGETTDCAEWDCHSRHRSIETYLEPDEPRSKWADMEPLDLKTYRVTKLCRCEWTGRAYLDLSEPREPRLGCRQCDPDDDSIEYPLVVHEQLPDEMVRDWKVELDCGHHGTDYFLPAEVDDPAAYRTTKPARGPRSCSDRACRPQPITRVHRLGAVAPARKTRETTVQPALDPVAATAADLKRRLTPAQRKALIAQLQEDT